MLGPISIGVRVVQFIIAVVILGLSVALLRAQVYGAAPVTTRFSVFLGAFGMITSSLGLTALFLERWIPSLIPLALDAVGGILLAAGGISWAIGLKGVSCTDIQAYETLYLNGLLNEGCIDGSDGVPYCGVFQGSNNNPDAFAKLRDNCKKAYADEICMFLAFGLALILVALGWLIMRKGAGGSKPRFVA